MAEISGGLAKTTDIYGIVKLTPKQTPNKIEC